MSLKNILVENNNHLYIKDATISGEILLTGTAEIDIEIGANITFPSVIVELPVKYEITSPPSEVDLGNKEFKIVKIGNMMQFILLNDGLNYITYKPIGSDQPGFFKIDMSTLNLPPTNDFSGTIPVLHNDSYAIGDYEYDNTVKIIKFKPSFGNYYDPITPVYPIGSLNFTGINGKFQGVGLPNSQFIITYIL